MKAWIKAYRWIAAMLLATPALAVAGTPCLQRSQDLLMAMKAGHYQAATVHFDGRVKAAIGADRLKAVWKQMLPLQFGRYDPSAPGQVAHAVAAEMVVTPLHFSNGWVDMRVACNAGGEISGFHFVPGTAPHGAATRKAVSGHWGVSRPTSVPSPLGPLPATLTLPQGKGPFAAVVLVAGSGAHDRDESIGPNKPFRDIARGLAAHGIASLRYDKRTFAHAAAMAAKEPMTIDNEVTVDA